MSEKDVKYVKCIKKRYKVVFVSRLLYATVQVLTIVLLSKGVQNDDYYF